MTELWKPIVIFLNALLKSEQYGAIWAPFSLSLLAYLPSPFISRPYFRDFLWYLKCQEEWGAGKGGWSECACCVFHWAVWRNKCNKARELYCSSLGCSIKRLMGDSCWLSARTRSPKPESLPNHTTNQPLIDTGWEELCHKSFKIRYWIFFGNPSHLRWKRSGPFREIFGHFQGRIPFCSNKPCCHPTYCLFMII